MGTTRGDAKGGVPARSEVNVTGYTVYRDLSNAWGTWASKAGSPRSKGRVARSLVPNRCKDVPVRVMNLASYPVTLTAGAVLAELEPVWAMDDVEQESETHQEAVSIESEEREALPEYVEERLARVDQAVPRATRQALIELLLRYTIAFSQGENDLGRAAAVRHRIETGDNRPFRQVLRRHPTALLEAIDLQVDTMLQADLIEPTQSEWMSNVVMVTKSDGFLRFCVDYRQLNAKAIKDAYPLPRIDVC